MDRRCRLEALLDCYADRVAVFGGAVVNETEPTFGQLGGDLILCEVVNVGRSEPVSYVYGFPVNNPPDHVCQRRAYFVRSARRAGSPVEGEQDGALVLRLDPQLFEESDPLSSTLDQHVSSPTDDDAIVCRVGVWAFITLDQTHARIEPFLPQQIVRRSHQGGVAFGTIYLVSQPQERQYLPAAARTDKHQTFALREVFG